MKKEVILAIIIGAILGLIITFGIYTASSATKPQVASPQPTPVASALVQGTNHVSITSPIADSLLDTDTTTVSGTTTPNATVAVIAPDSNTIVVADKDGRFSADVTLEGGINIITATSFDKDGNKATTQVTVVYSTASI